MAKFFAYGRHSTAKQGITEEVQRKRLEDYWGLHLQPQGVEWGGWYYDAAVSAGKPMTERPKGLELWALCQPGDHVGVAKLDRAFRRMKDAVTTMSLFDSKQVKFHLLDVRVDTSTPIGQCMLSILVAFAQLERDLASERTRDALAAKRERGDVHSPAPPIGWRYIRGKMQVNQQEREMIEGLYAEYEAGSSIEAIYLRLRSRGIKRHGRGWHVKTVRRAFAARAAGYPKTAAPDTFCARGSLAARRSRQIGGPVF